MEREHGLEQQLNKVGAEGATAKAAAAEAAKKTEAATANFASQRDALEARVTAAQQAASVAESRAATFATEAQKAEGEADDLAKQVARFAEVEKEAGELREEVQHWRAAANNLSVVERELTNTEGAREALAKQAQDAELKSELTASKQAADTAARDRATFEKTAKD